MNPKAFIRARARKMLALGAAAAGLALLGWAWLGDRNGASDIPTAQVRRGPVLITVTEVGELRAADQVTISAPNEKTIVWMVPEGTRVSKGDPLIRFESRKYEILTEAAQSAVAVARADLRRAESELAGQRAAEKKARLDYESLPELAEKGFITTNELEAARLEHEEVRAQTRSFGARLEAARASVEQAENQVEQERRRLSEREVRAPRDGVVVYAVHGDDTEQRKVEVGMLPFEGMALMYLPDPENMTVATEISEYDLAKIRVGSPVELRLQAYSEVTFAGRVAQIASLARRKISRVTGKPTGLKIFDVTIEVLDHDERLRPGLSATVEIVVSEHPDSLYVPVAGIFVDELDRLVAYRRNGHGWEATLLEVGGSTDRVAILNGGLDEGEEIALVRPPGR